MKNNRRTVLKKVTLGLAGVFGISQVSAAEKKTRKNF